MIAQALLCLTMVIHGEARGEPFYGQIAVGAVVVNRATENQTAICKEAKATAQFAPLKTRTDYRSFSAALISYTLYQYLPAALRRNWYFSSSKDSCYHYGTYNMTIANHRFYTKQ